MARRSCSQLVGHDWNLSVTENPNDTITVTPDRMQVALLWEILQELKQINQTLNCRNTRDIPVQLRGLRRDLKALRDRKEIL